MTLTPGTLFGPYKVAALIGAGGMGEVYSGTDTRLKRDVAIKVLPPLFASDADRLARFQREAEVLASLNHTNIAHVYGLEQSDGRTALAMELVEGETLAERIARGPIPVDEALVIARQIADALEAAHARGVVHRDLKPGNVKLTPDGTVKVLDFGIAKALGARTTGAPLTTSATQTGAVLGTPAYMSPEQARGQSVDERADIWAFGCVLFEMLAGQPPFASQDVTLTPASLRASGATVDGFVNVPPAVRRTIKLCLESDVRKRIRHIGDVRLALDGAFESSTPASVATPTRGRWASLTAYAVGALVLLALAVPALRHLRETPPPETRLDIVTPATPDATSFALSPDGRQIVFVASGPGGAQLWLRSLASATA
jgi:serine/threonine protein kinase